MRYISQNAVLFVMIGFVVILMLGGLSACDPPGTWATVTPNPTVGIEPTETPVPTVAINEVPPLLNPEPSNYTYLSNVSCEGKPLSKWYGEGVFTIKTINTHEQGMTYTYIKTDFSNQPSPYNLWDPSTCFGVQHSYFEFLPTAREVAPVPGLNTSYISQCSNLTQQVIGWEEITTVLGTFNALHLVTELKYAGEYSGCYTGKEDSWFTCGYGFIFSQIQTDNCGQAIVEVAELVSYAPTRINENRVRYILTDIQLGIVSDYYRSNMTNEETAEAVRRWDAGIRVTNINDFERKLINGQWQVVYAGTETPIIGSDVILSTEN